MRIQVQTIRNNTKNKQSITMAAAAVNSRRNGDDRHTKAAQLADQPSGRNNCLSNRQTDGQLSIKHE